jgi:small subunit ribosomal protein S2
LGGTLTNFTTIKASIDRMRRIDVQREKGELDFFNKKERANIENEYQRLLEYLEGIREMKEPPAIMFVVDLKKEHIAIAEARRLGIPVVGVADTNADPEAVEYPIPGNDDAIRSIKLFTTLIADAYNEGAKLYEEKIRSSTDKGADAPKEAKTDKRAPKTAEKPAAVGPAVVKMKRKLVAAGTAEDVEISAELEQKPAGAALVEDENSGESIGESN